MKNPQNASSERRGNGHGGEGVLTTITRSGKILFFFLYQGRDCLVAAMIVLSFFGNYSLPSFEKVSLDLALSQMDVNRWS